MGSLSELLKFAEDEAVAEGRLADRQIQGGVPLSLAAQRQ